jgi:two-component system, NtrC family, response regulator AtoC
MNLLVVDDDKVTRDLLREILEKEKYDVTLASSGEEALKLLTGRAFPVVLSDIRMLEVGGMAVLDHIKQKQLGSVVILMTGFGTMEGAIEAIRQGAFDYISKPFRLEELKALVARGWKHWEDIQKPLKRGLAPENVGTPRTLIGKSPAIVDVYKTLARATLSPSNVLIVGESGTGKELVARAIHENSTRKKNPFIAVNCGALTETLLESELFGHVKGSFTGAITNKKGLFEEANEGTLFLDEIGDISSSLQVKLLRVIQEGEFKPVGSNESKKVDVRTIAATHANLEKAIAEGSFREDLYYRLKVILIEIPPLRERMDDLPDLVNHFVSLYSKKIGKQVSHISDESMVLLRSYLWPGNIRELEHAIERAVTMTRTTVLYPEDFPPEICPRKSEELGDNALDPTSLEYVEKEHILKVLEGVGFNRSKAASILGIDRKTLHRKAQRYGILLKDK